MEFKLRSLICPEYSSLYLFYPKFLWLSTSPLVCKERYQHKTLLVDSVRESSFDRRTGGFSLNFPCYQRIQRGFIPVELPVNREEKFPDLDGVVVDVTAMSR